MLFNIPDSIINFLIPKVCLMGAAATCDSRNCEDGCNGHLNTHQVKEGTFLIHYNHITISVEQSEIDSCGGCFFDCPKGCLLEALEDTGIDCVAGGSFRRVH